MNIDTVMRVLTFMNQVNEGVFGDSESNQKEIIEFLSSVPDFGDFVEKEKIIDCNISAVFTAHETGFHLMWRLMDVNLAFYMLLWELLLMLQDVIKFHLWLYVWV